MLALQWPTVREKQVLKELSTKRIGFDKAAFVQTSADLLPVLCQAWDAQWAVIEGLLPMVAAGNVPGSESEAGAKAAEAMSLGTVCVKVGSLHNDLLLNCLDKEKVLILRNC